MEQHVDETLRQDSSTHEEPVSSATFNGDESANIHGVRDHTLNEQETAVGITTLISPDVAGFQCVFKQRYTDFQVNEILPNGEVLHLNELVLLPNQDRKEKEDIVTSDPTAATAQKVDATEPVNAKRGGDDSINPQEQKRVKVDVDTQPQSQDAARPADDSAPAVEEAIAALDPADLQNIKDIFGPGLTDEIVELYRSVLKYPHRKPRDHATIKSAPIESKTTRTQVHGIIRKLFNSRLETSTLQDEPGRMSVRAAPPHAMQSNGKDERRNTNNRNQKKGRVDWHELGGEFLHFTLYKENKDTMETLYFMASELRIKVSNFQFAGTKDRRGVTVQRVAAYRVQKERLIGLSRTARGWKVGGFEYKRHGLQLGDLKGNEFVLTLRQVKIDGLTSSTVETLDQARVAIVKAGNAFATRGFINYYGLQRFGALKTGTHVTGMRIIQGDLEAAVNGILTYDESLLPDNIDPVSQAKVPKDDIQRARAIHAWRTTGDLTRARQQMPRRFQAETNIMQALSRKQDGKGQHDKDWQGALMTIQRGLRLMYVHAYQSFVWNTVAAKRWHLYGSTVVEGDLVVVGEHESEAANKLQDSVDQDGEEVVHASASADPDEHIENDFTRARPLSKEEADSGQYGIYDIVLPLPGWDVVYPSNELGKFYETFMASEQGGKLDPHDMRRTWKDASLSGGYRKMMARPLNGVNVEVHSYQGEQQLAPTDVDRLNGSFYLNENGPAEEQEVAVVMRFQLGSSQYATMALRELTKGGARPYTPEFFSAR